MVYASLLIPFVVVLVAYLKFPHTITVGEIAIPIVVGALTTVAAAMYGNHKVVEDTEYWNGLGTHSFYYEPWNEKVPCTHTKYCTDSKGNSYACGTQHSYDVDYHPAYYEIHDTNGLVADISGSYFNRLTGYWGNKSFVEMNRDYHTIDGDAYRTTWDKSYEKSQLVVTEHTYENKVAVSDSVQKWQKVDPEGLFEYKDPNNGYVPSIQGLVDKEALKHLDYVNGVFGPTKQIRVILLVFNNVGIEKAFDQQEYWRNGNKNELVICVGLRDNVIDWAHTFSWTDVRTLLAGMKGYIADLKGQPYDQQAHVKWISENLSEWKRKSFKDFDWIWVDTPLWVYVLTASMTLITSILATIFIVRNEHGNRRYYRNRF